MAMLWLVLVVACLTAVAAGEPCDGTEHCASKDSEDDAAMLQVKEKTATNNNVELIADNGRVSIISGDSTACQNNGNKLQYYGLDKYCQVQVTFNSGQTCTGKFGITEPDDYILIHEFGPDDCLKVSRTSGNQASGSNWPCQDDGCYYHLKQGMQIWVTEGHMAPLSLSSLWKPISNDATVVTVTNTENVKTSYGKASSLTLSASSSVSYAGAKMSASATSKVSQNMQEALQHGSESISQTTFTPCPEGQNPWQYVIRIEGQGPDADIGTEVVRCTSGDNDGPKCPVALCGSKVPGANDCQCCFHMQPQCQ